MPVYQRQEQYNGPRSKCTDFKTCPPVGQLIYEVTTMLTRERATELNNTMVTEEHLLHTAEPLREAGMDVKDVAAIVIEGMKEHAAELGLQGSEE